MDTNRQEKLDSSSHSEATRAPERQKPEGLKEVKTKAKELLKSESSEAAEGQEGVELSEGKVGETVGEDKAHAPVGGGQKSYSADEIEAIRAKLLAALPPQEVMIRQIKRKLYKEEKVLTKRMNGLRKKSHTQAWQLTIVVAQLRKIREYFSMLAHATFEMVKHLWLKIVHGV